MSALAAALDTLAASGVAAGVAEATARDEGARLAAAVAESAPGAGPEWLEAVGRADAGLEAFFTAAAAGRRWRASPTDSLVRLVADGSPHAGAYAQALAAVVSAGSALGDAGIGAIASASATAAAQLAAASPRPGAGSTGYSAPVRPSAPSVPAAPVTGSPADPFRDLALPPGVPGVDEILSRLGRGPGGGTTGPGQADGGAPTAPGPSAPSGPAAAPAAAPAEEPADPDENALPVETLDDLLAELDALIGLDRVKSEIKRQAQLLRIDTLRSQAGMATPTLTRHLVFTGNPGTGKTTVARLVARIYRALGILSKGLLVEVDRSELVAGYLGQTASRTSEVIASARGGVLFIDEAYSLAIDQYGAEAVTTLVKDMEDHRADLVVIVAGYSGPMQSFLDTNPGLASRFSTTIDFADYTDDELRAIFERLAESADFDPTAEALDAFSALASQQARTEAFGNGRWVRNVLDAAIAQHAWRLRDVESPTLDELRVLLPDDIAGEAATGTEPDESGEPQEALLADAVERGLAAGAAGPVTAEPGSDADAGPDPESSESSDPSVTTEEPRS